MPRRISRACFLKGAAGLALAVVAGKYTYDHLAPANSFPCRLLGPSMAAGHMLRDGNLPVPAQAGQAGQAAVAIVGGGIAGLSAAWWLKKHGFSDFTLLELEDRVGGNSSSGSNKFGSYPWGAHYIPLANRESVYVRELFQELKIIESFDASGLPVYNELYLCHEPQERLFKDGAFQEGLVPRRGLQPADRLEMDRFFAVVKRLRAARGRDGRPAFAIPLDLSSQDEEFTRLDGISMSDWLRQSGFRGRPLHWYVDYCCRDDYGSTADSVSAWAGIHYFAGRRGEAANAEPNSVVTWPEGNGFVVERLAGKVADRIVTGALVSRIERQGDELVIAYRDKGTGEWRFLSARCVIFAAPRFLARHIIADFDDPVGREQLVYAPWLVANISVSAVPEAPGIDLAWDNVSYYSQSLGYVVSSHQDITTRDGPKVLTYYCPLAAEEPAQARRRLSAASARAWAKLIVDDLESMHRGIARNILAMDIWPWGHGMIRPSVGFIWGEGRRKMKEEAGGVIFAHSDMSGISNFEEAQYRGVEAARLAVAKVAS